MIDKFLTAIVQQNKITKQIIVVSSDIVVCYLSFLISLYLLNFTFTLDEIQIDFKNFIIQLLFIPLFYYFKLYSSLFRFTDFKTIIDSLKAILIYKLIIIFLANIFDYNELFLLQVNIIHFFIFLFLTIVSRIFFITLYNKTIKKDYVEKQSLIIYGAGELGLIIKSEISKFNVLAFIDDDYKKQNRYISGIKIYSLEDGINLIKERDINNLFVAIINFPREKRNNLISKLENLNINLKFIPNIKNLIDGKFDPNRFSPIDLSDLIPQKSHIKLDKNKNFFLNKDILVTGAGGSIGSELVDQLIFMPIKTLMILDHSEFSLYKIEMQLRQKINDHKLNVILKSFLENAQNLNSIDNIFSNNNVDIVIHSAAYKHVYYSEFNIKSFLKNNILSTKNLAEISIKHNIENFILVSTDKAVNPKSPMGKTKRISEILIQILNNNSNITKLSIVRFGNVVNSAGSVIPLFQEQIKKGGPITVTHPEVKRYFMLISDAASLVLNSIILSKGGEIFVLNMGEEIKIIDIAKKMIRLSGKTIKSEKNKNGEIEIKFIGLRSSEKLSEELTTESKLAKTTHPEIFISEDKYIKSKEQKFYEFIKNFELNIEKNKNNFDAIFNLFLES